VCVVLEASIPDKMMRFSHLNIASASRHTPVRPGLIIPIFASSLYIVSIAVIVPVRHNPCPDLYACCSPSSSALCAPRNLPGVAVPSGVFWRTFASRRSRRQHQIGMSCLTSIVTMAKRTTILPGIVNKQRKCYRYVKLQHFLLK
jgi:hypothetical protein